MTDSTRKKLVIALFIFAVLASAAGGILIYLGSH